MPTPTPLRPKAEYDVQNHQAVIVSEEEQTVAVIFACYVDGVLSQINVKENQRLKAGVNNVSKPENFDDTNDNVKVYVWCSLNSMKPVI